MYMIQRDCNTMSSLSSNNQRKAKHRIRQIKDRYNSNIIHIGVDMVGNSNNDSY